MCAKQIPCLFWGTFLCACKYLYKLGNSFFMILGIVFALSEEHSVIALKKISHHWYSPQIRLRFAVVPEDNQH